MEQIDPELERFDRHRVREIRAKYDQTAAAFLAEFQSTAASLKPDERIELVVYAYESSMELLKAMLSNPHANKICYLFWGYDGEEDVNSVVPLLINNCPELASLQVEFKHHFAFDFVSSVLEHPSNKVKVLHIPPKTKGDLPRFFAALGQSQVSALTLSTGDSPEFSQGLCEYLAKDLLVRLKVFYSKSVPSEMTASLANCTRLAKLEMLRCEFSQPTSFTLPKSITKLTLDYCWFVDGFDWSFLADSNVRELDFESVREVEGTQLGSALAVHLRAKGLDKLRFHNCDFVNETLAKVGVEIGRITRLILECRRINDAFIKLIVLVLQSPNSEVKELRLWYGDNTASIVKDHLVPALKHPNCNLAKLSLRADRDREAAGRVEAMFRNRLVLFVLLQGRQVGRLYCPLRRLPVEMFRLVAAALI
ncbi:hypothetical protein BASA81_015156 [Batrachochytrium salamandrivorans]|nr:hypothetical protein BASA81_015156 [Batrachochytrium salamandrivorans]